MKQYSFFLCLLLASTASAEPKGMSVEELLRQKVRPTGLDTLLGPKIEFSCVSTFIKGGEAPDVAIRKCAEQAQNKSK